MAETPPPIIEDPDKRFLEYLAYYSDKVRRYTGLRPSIFIGAVDQPPFAKRVKIGEWKGIELWTTAEVAN